MATCNELAELGLREKTVRLEEFTVDERVKRWRETRIYQGDIAVCAAPFDAIEIDLGVLWSPARSG